MESTAQYWKPVWETLERHWQTVQRQQAEACASAGKLHLAQAKSNCGPRGRKNDFGDAERLVKRLGSAGTSAEFRPRAGTTSVAHRKPQAASTEATEGSVTKSAGVPFGRRAH